MSTKLQINSLEALERLIGGDTETEIDIRNSVVQKFADKHLKCLANGLYDQKYNEFLHQLEKSIKEQFVQEFGLVESGAGHYGSPKVLKLSDASKERFRAEVKAYVEKFIFDATEVALHNAREMMDKHLKSRVDYHINRMLGEQTEKMIMEKVKEKLGTVDFTKL